MRVFDLCSGIGGFRVGMELSSYSNSEIQFNSYSDIDKYANTAYQLLFNTQSEINLGDIQKHTRFESEKETQGKLPSSRKRNILIDQAIPDIDLLFAGFPCQPHSLMGNRKGNSDARGNIFYDIVEILRVKKPEYFVLENVKSLISVNNGTFYKEIIKTLTDDLNYDINVMILNASDYGVPQTRRRVFIIGSKTKDLSKISTEIHKVDLLKTTIPSTWHLLDKNVDMKYYLSERILKTILKDQHKGYNRKAEINKLIARPICKTMHKMHRASQDNYYSDSFIQGQYKKETNIVSLADIEENRIRRITPEEAFRIQSFPEKYIKKLIASNLSDTRLYMLAGNSVPPKMVKAVLNSFLE